MPQDCLSADKIITFIGTNRQNYEVAFGLSRTFVGKGSDGLVKIQNADLAGFDIAGFVEPCAKAFAFRSHSGFCGIENSEEGYQNLQRFLFGTYRVDVWLDVNDVKLPPGKLVDAEAKGTLDASYPVEVLISLRNKQWYLTRRVGVEDSAAVVEHKALRQAGEKKPAVQKLLSTVFMADWGKRNLNDPTAAYRLQLNVLMPDFQVNGADASECQYEGSKIFSGAVIILRTTDTVPWTAKYYWESDAPGSTAPPVQRDLAPTPGGPGWIRQVFRDGSGFQRAPCKSRRSAAFSNQRVEVAFIGPKPTAGRCRRLCDDMLAARRGGPFESFNRERTMCGTASFGVRELIAQLLERGMAMQTFWGFYITVSLSLVVFLGYAKHSSPPIISGIVVSIMFGAFAYVNAVACLQSRPSESFYTTPFAPSRT